jgi:hypothetical protein
MSADWSAPTSWDDVCRRAGGRRRYNAARRERKMWRRTEILIRTVGVDRRLYGLQAQLARVLGVSPATISRDFAAIRNAHKGALLR